MDSSMGTVFWFTGLSGAGKTTVGRQFFELLRGHRPAVVFLDGDTLREVFGNDLGHSRESRVKSAMRNARLCRMLAGQGVDVVCATISMFHECQQWNRANIAQYREIYLKVPMQVLIERDQKQLYSRAARGEVLEVMGVDLAADEPRIPDIVVENDGRMSPAQVAAMLHDRFLKS